MLVYGDLPDICDTFTWTRALRFEFLCIHIHIHRHPGPHLLTLFSHPCFYRNILKWLVVLTGSVTRNSVTQTAQIWNRHIFAWELKLHFFAFVPSLVLYVSGFPKSNLFRRVYICPLVMANTYHCVNIISLVRRVFLVSAFVSRYVAINYEHNEWMNEWIQFPCQ